MYIEIFSRFSYIVAYRKNYILYNRVIIIIIIIKLLLISKLTQNTLLLLIHKHIVDRALPNKLSLNETLPHWHSIPRRSSKRDGFFL